MYDLWRGTRLIPISFASFNKFYAFFFFFGLQFSVNFHAFTKHARLQYIFDMTSISIFSYRDSRPVDSPYQKETQEIVAEITMAVFFRSKSNNRSFDLFYCVLQFRFALVIGRLFGFRGLRDPLNNSNIRVLEIWRLEINRHFEVLSPTICFCGVFFSFFWPF